MAPLSWFGKIAGIGPPAGSSLGVRRRQPEAAARALLIVIAADPEFVMRSLAKSA